MNFNKTYGERQGRFDIETIKAAAKRRAIEILEKVAGIDSALLDGKHHPCPKCGGTDRFRLIDADAGAVYCNQCFRDKSQGNWGDCISAVQRMNDCDFPTAIKLIGEYLGGTEYGDMAAANYGGVETSANSIRSIPATSSRTSAHSSNTASPPPSNKKPAQPTEEPSSTSASRAIKPAPKKIFYYPNAKGRPAYRIVKYPTPPGAKKDFRQERFENDIGRVSQWVSGLGFDENGVKRSFIPYPYNFPRLMDERKSSISSRGKNARNACKRFSTPTLTLLTPRTHPGSASQPQSPGEPTT